MFHIIADRYEMDHHHNQFMASYIKIMLSSFEVKQLEVETIFTPWMLRHLRIYGQIGS